MNKSDLWESLRTHHKKLKLLHLRDLFKQDTERTSKFSLTFDEIVIDFSKNRFTGETMSLLWSLAKSCELKDKIEKLFSGEKINTTEDRPALHTALRAPTGHSLEVDGVDLSMLVHTELSKLEKFVTQLHEGSIKGASGKAIDTIINIGIGGSDLGPRLGVEALHAYRQSNVTLKFVANLDPKDLYSALENANPETTLFILASKSFTTQETFTNALTAENWLVKHGCHNTKQHFVGVTSNAIAARDYGLDDDRIFQIWDWVGGRYSVWSAIGLPLAIAIGMQQFREFLNGAHAMDTHFRTSVIEENIPITLGLLGIWYNNFFGADTHAVVPYDQGLRLLPEYLSQLVMESNGKGVDNNGNDLSEYSSPVNWGSVGSNAQHAFFQLLHQSKRLIPIDFLLPLKSTINDEQHKKLVANCLAQSKALMLGEQNISEPHRHFPGNRPSTTILYKQLSPYTLGILLALYEHKTFVEAMIWNINPFDQWGVELGKKLTTAILDELDGSVSTNGEHDPSTLFLLEQYRKEN